MSKDIVPPQATIRRLSIYLRFLSSLEQDDVQVVSSQEMANRLALNPAQVRKDLAYFGEFGKRGVGYSVNKLRDHIIKILGLQRERQVAIIGAGGRLGRALALYTGFEKRNFRISALFDVDPEVIGTVLLSDAGPVAHLDSLCKIVNERNIEIVILTVPASAIKGVYDLVLQCGVKAVLNFAPFKLISTKNVVVQNVDLTTELESLSYHLHLKEALKENIVPVE